MVHHKPARLDAVFAALSDATRRSVLDRLEAGSCSVTELAQPHDMSLPGFMKHLAVLEAAGLIARSKEGRVVRCELDATPMQEASTWIRRYERFWTERLDALGRYLYHQEDISPCKAPRTPTTTSSASAASITSSRKRSGARGPSRKR